MLVFQSKLIEVKNIIIDSKSGVSGAGLYSKSLDLTGCLFMVPFAIYSVQLLILVTPQDVVQKRQICTRKLLKVFTLMVLPDTVMVRILILNLVVRFYHVLLQNSHHVLKPPPVNLSY